MGIGRKIKALIDTVFAKPSIYFQESGSNPSYGLDAAQLADIFREAASGDVLRQTELFEEMEEKDTHLTSVLQTRKLAVSGLDYEIMPAGENVKQKDTALFIEKIIPDIQGFNDSLRDILDALGKGFSVSEIIYKYNNGKIEIESIERINQERFVFAAEDGILLKRPRLLTEEAMSYGIELPEYKFIYFKYNPRSGIAPKAGLLRPIAWMYLFKNYSLKDWVIFNERYAMPSRIGKYSGGATESQIKELEKAVRRIGTDAAAVISDNTIIELIESKARGEVGAYEKLCKYADDQISKAVLGQTLTSGTGSSGSYAQAKVHNMVRQDLLKSDMISLAEVIRDQIIKPLVRLNFGNDAPIPKFKFQSGNKSDLKTDSEILKNLGEAGFDQTPVSYVHKHYGIPVPQKGEKTLITAQPSAKGLPMKTMISKSAIPNAAADNGAAELASLQKSLADNTENALGELLNPIFQLADESASFEELKQKLQIVYDRLDDNQIAMLMNQALYLAELYGSIQKAE